MANAIDDVKILPCPFCGYALTAEEGLCPHSGWHSEDDGEWHLTGICCPTCAVFLPKPSENATTADAIDAWNSRVEQVSTARQGENISVEVSDDKLSYLRDRVGSGGGIDGPDAYALLTELRDHRASPAPSQHTGWSDEAVEAILYVYRRKVKEYEADFRRDEIPENFWERKYGTNLHSTGLGEKWALRTALTAASSIAPATRMPHSGVKVSDIVAMIDADTIAPATGFEPQHIDIAHDGFSGDVIGSYITREGKRGFVVQQDDTRVVHVYGEKFASISPSVAKESGEP